MRILWTDESADVRQCVQSILGTQFDVQTVDDPELALELAAAAPPDLLCAPAVTRRKSGVELARALRALPGLSQTIVILSCPRVQALECPEELLQHADDLLPMPFSAHELSARIRMYARLLRARNEALERARSSELRVHEWEARFQSVASANDALFASLGHELRTPLTAILLWAGSLCGRQVSEAELGHAVSAIVASAQTQLQRFDVLLDMSRFAAGKLVLNRRTVSLDTLVRGVHDQMRAMAASKAVVLELGLREVLGSADVDPKRLQQVLLHLLANAIKFTQGGGRVTLRACRDDDRLELEVSDTGEGIAPEVLPLLFERFPRSQNGEARSHAALGRGLALSRHLVELHGGTLEAHSAGLGQGTSFRLRLPQRRAERPSGTQAGPVPAALAARALRGRSVLLVEDAEGTREAMQLVLERTGMRVLVAGSGPEALALLGAGAEAAPQPCERSSPADVDVILCDLELPGMNGYDFIAHVAQAYQRRNRRPPAACAVSGHVRALDRQLAIAAGFDLHLSKPFTMERLIEAVDDLCQVAAAETASS
jgi:signal transduction histidine kinase